ncbi:uncharacterized protein METZ01_LOCUS107646, partial [marine metagenome]
MSSRTQFFYCRLKLSDYSETGAKTPAPAIRYRSRQASAIHPVPLTGINT